MRRLAVLLLAACGHASATSAPATPVAPATEPPDLPHAASGVETTESPASPQTGSGAGTAESAPAPHAGGASATTEPVQPEPLPAGVKEIVLPGADGGVFLDYLAYDANHHRVWVPASGTGKVDVIDARTGAVTPIDGWATKEFERRGQKRLMGPTAATIGDGVVFIGNRGDSSICALDAKTLARQGCVTLDGVPDGLQYVSATHEVWVTTPRDQRIVIVDVKKSSAMKVVGKIDFDGEPEGFAVDNKRRVFFTNLEDKDKTLVVDVAKRAVIKTWEPKCGEDGPKGLIFDDRANHLLVVCPASLEVLDVAKDGAQLSTLEVGDGLDAVDWLASKRLVVAAAARAEKLVVASLPADGKLVAVATTPTRKGARNAVISEDGTSFVADGPAGSILMVSPAKK